MRKWFSVILLEHITVTDLNMRWTTVTVRYGEGIFVFLSCLYTVKRNNVSWQTSFFVDDLTPYTITRYGP